MRLLLWLVAISAFGQSNAVDFTALPSYLIAIGAQVNPYGVSTVFAARVGQQKLYALTSIDTPAKDVSAALSVHNYQPLIASLRFGVAYVVAHSDRCFLYVLGDGGGSYDGVLMLGAFSGGGGVMCHTRRFPNVYMGPAVRAIKVSSYSVQPVASFMLGMSFGKIK